MNCLDYSDSDAESDVHIKPQVGARPAVAVPSPGVKRLLDQDDDGGDSSEVTSVQPAKKKKLLPKLTPAFQTAPIDDPTLHQGRVRARPWVQGEYPAHIYLELKLSKRLRDRLGEIIDRVQVWVEDARSRTHSSADGEKELDHPIHALFARDPTAQPTGNNNGNKDNENLKPRPTPPTPTPTPTLHISLSHPLPLRQFQIPLLLDHMRRPTGINGPLRVGLEGGFRAYTNGMHSEGEEEGTGDVDVAVEDEEVGVVQGEDKSGGGKKNVLQDLGRGGLGKRSRAFLALKVGVGHDKLLKIQTETIDQFLKIHHLPRYHRSPEFHTSFAWTLLNENTGSPFDESLLTRLEREFGEGLRGEMRNGWEVRGIKVRVGKVVHSFEV